MLAPMQNATALVASDVHLGGTSPEMSQAFHRWLERAAEEAGTLVLNGDLFDFWFEYRSVIPRGHMRTLTALRRLVEGGVDVHLVGGNHDWWGGSFLTDEIGVQFHRDPVTLSLGGRRALVAHGDGLGRGDIGYRLLRNVLRGRITQWGFRWIHPDLGAALARAISRTGDSDETVPTGPEHRTGALERWARDRLLEDDSLDLVLLGHTHSPVSVEVAPGRFYLNSGDWVTHASFVRLAFGQPPELCYWEG